MAPKKPLTLRAISHRRGNRLLEYSTRSSITVTELLLCLLLKKMPLKKQKNIFFKCQRNVVVLDFRGRHIVETVVAGESKYFNTVGTEQSLTYYNC